MKNMNLRYAQGRTLVELMISMAIGLIIMLAVSTLYVTNTQTYRVTDDKALLEEDGRLALAAIAFNVRMAGYGQLTDASPLRNGGGGVTSFTGVGQAIQGCTGGFTSPTAIPMTCTGSTAAPDSFLVRYVIDGVNSNLTGGVPTDCLGQGVAGGIVENRFYVQLNPVTNRRELFCAGNGGTAPGAANLASAGQPIADNVIDMKVTYGYDQDDNQSVDGFYSAASLAAGTTVPMPAYKDPDPTLLPPEIQALMTDRFYKVLSAKVCIVMRSANDNITPSPQKYRDCTGAVVTAPDRRLYSAFSSVVSVRGRTNGRTL
ncbi:MAG: PilW family protein [Pseudomonadota bacterium]